MRKIENKDIRKQCDECFELDCQKRFSAEYPCKDFKTIKIDPELLKRYRKEFALLLCVKVVVLLIMVWIFVMLILLARDFLYDDFVKFFYIN